MSIFEFYLKMGIDHIADFQGYDHILFILSLTVVYSLKYWKYIFILVTAFTLGHSLTLLLATLNIVTIPTNFVEFLIPVTIFITAFSNTFQKAHKFYTGFYQFKYVVTLFFGLIHGMGFSNYLKGLLSGEERLFLPLLSFNLGIELGQILILICILGISLLFVDIFGVKRKDWNMIFSGAALGISFILAIERWPW